MINLILKLKRLSSLARLSLARIALSRPDKNCAVDVYTVSKFAIRLLLYTTNDQDGSCLVSPAERPSRGVRGFGRALLYVSMDRPI